MTYRIGTQEMQTPWMIIVGEVTDVKEYSRDLPSQEQYYQPVDQFERSLGSLAAPGDPPKGDAGFVIVRTATQPEQMIKVLRATVSSMDAQLPLTQIETMERVVADSDAPRRFNTAIISAFAIAAALLAATGIYSVIAFSTALRLQEMAIRLALGSQRWGIVGLVVASAAKLAIAGCAIGLLGVGAASALLGSFLFGVSPFDPLVLTLAVVFVLLLTGLASLLPARRAVSVNLIEALRAE